MRFKNKLELIFTRETSKQHQSSEEPVLLHTYIIHATCTSINERSKRKQGKQGKASLSLSLSSSNSQGDVSLQDFCSTRSRGCRIFFFIKESPPVVESAPIGLWVAPNWLVTSHGFRWFSSIRSFVVASSLLCGVL